MAKQNASIAVLLISVTPSHLNNINTNSRLQHSDQSEFYALHIDATQVLLQPYNKYTDCFSYHSTSNANIIHGLAFMGAPVW